MKELLDALNRHRVEYLIVGGFAFAVHAEPRATKDLDLFIRSGVRNSEAVFRALCEYGAPLEGLTVEDFRDARTGLQVGVPPNRIDILQKIDGVTFDEAWGARIKAVFGADTPVFVISREHLIRNKLAAGRPRDLLGVEEIRNAGSPAAETRRKKAPSSQRKKTRK
jgi:hypothetical protein